MLPQCLGAGQHTFKHSVWASCTDRSCLPVFLKLVSLPLWGLPVQMSTTTNHNDWSSPVLQADFSQLPLLLHKHKTGCLHPHDFNPTSFRFSITALAVAFRNTLLTFTACIFEHFFCVKLTDGSKNCTTRNSSALESLLKTPSYGDLMIYCH